MSVNYAAYIFNHMSNEKCIVPIDVFTGTQAPRHKLFDIHTWGCPVCVLDPTLQEGKKIPRRQLDHEKEYLLVLVIIILVIYRLC